MITGLPAAATLDALLEALERAGIGCTIVLDRGGRLDRIYANEALARIFGVDREAAMRIAPLDVLAGSERARLAEMRHAARSGDPRRPLSLETRIVRADGSELPVEVGLGYATLDSAQATFVFIRDVSEKTSMERALRLSEERFRMVAEASPDSITVIAGGRYVYANPVALSYLGLRSLEELPTVVPISRVPAEQRDEALAIGERLSAGESVRPREVRITTPDGRELLLEVSLSMTSMEGQPAIVSYARDITERVRLQARVMQQDRLASVGMLAAGVAHELNNPLTSLGMQARRLRADADKHGLPAEVRQILDQMDEAATRMNAIIADLLFMARPVEQPQAHVDVVQIVRSSVALLRAGMSRSPAIHLELEGLPSIQGYASRLGQVFLNVLRNAAQAVEQVEGGEIHVRARLDVEALRIEVTDNGPGIPAALLERVTAPFFTTKPHGTGLGLWISQELMAHHGGTLELASAPGKGTTVTLSFPQPLEAAATPQSGKV